MPLTISNPGGIIFEIGTSGTAGTSGKGIVPPIVADISNVSTSGVIEGTILFDGVSKQLFLFDGTQWKAGGFDQYVFPNDLEVSLPNNKTFGRYESGDTIPAQGKTPAEVIELAIVEPINPTVTLTSPTTIQFNQTAINNVLNFSYVINSLNATVQSVSLEWRRNNTGSWTVLTTNTGLTTYTHTLTDTNYNTQPFNYRYIVTDSVGGTTTATLNITPAAYVAPTRTLTVTGNAITSPETNTKREKGNVNTQLGGSITRNSVNVNLTSYTLQYSTNNSTWNDIGSPVSISGGSATITSTQHNDTSLKTSNNIYYRVKVTDAYQDFLGTAVYSTTTTVTFLNLIFYGTASQIVDTSSEVRALGSRIFTDGSNPFILNTGSSLINFAVGMPASLSITSVIDLTALNANITSEYELSTFNVDDAGGTATSYDVYNMEIAIPYSENHQHQITRA